MALTTTIRAELPWARGPARLNGENVVMKVDAYADKYSTHPTQGIDVELSRIRHPDHAVAFVRRFGLFPELVQLLAALDPEVTGVVAGIAAGDLTQVRPPHPQLVPGQEVDHVRDGRGAGDLQVAGSLFEERTRPAHDAGDGGGVGLRVDGVGVNEIDVVREDDVVGVESKAAAGRGRSAHHQ